jgi:uncharacterized protein YkwD
MLDRAGRRLRRAAAPLALLAFLLPAAVMPAVPAANEETRSADPEVRELVRLVNRHRVRIGRRALVWDGRAARVAEAHSRAMRRRNFFDHVDPDGRSPFDRLDEAGVAWRAAAENIAHADASPERILEGWLASPGHRRNLESGSSSRHGIGRSGAYWTHVFFKP